jgi:hypothetical protein
MSFALSLSKGEWHAPRRRSWFDDRRKSLWDELTTNGKAAVSHIYSPQYLRLFETGHHVA